MALVNGGGKKLQLFSDSNGYGYAIDIAFRWSARLCNALNYQDYNSSQSGQSLELWGGNPVFNKTNIPVFDSTQGYLVIALGTNDVRGGSATSSANFYTLLLDAIDYAHNTKGWPYAKIVLPTINFMVDFGNGNLAKQLDYNEKIRQVALLRTTCYLDLYTYFNSLSNKVSLLQSDGLHLTQDGGHPAVFSFYRDADYTPYTGEVVPLPNLIEIKGHKFVMVA